MIQAAPTHEKPTVKIAGFRRESLPDAVEKHLRNAIMRGAYRAEILPSERDLAASYGVSRPVIRIALSRIADAGLIRQQHGCRTRILHPVNDGTRGKSAPAKSSLREAN